MHQQQQQKKLRRNGEEEGKKSSAKRIRTNMGLLFYIINQFWQQGTSRTVYVEQIVRIEMSAFRGAGKRRLNAKLGRYTIMEKSHNMSKMRKILLRGLTICQFVLFT